MKKIQHIFSAFIAIIGMAILSSCQHDSCVDLNCELHGGSCIDDVCVCPPGYEGAECEIPSYTRFVGMWVGTSKCDFYPQKVDTVEVYLVDTPNTIKIMTGMGSSSIRAMYASAETPEAEFATFADGDVIVRPYMRVDANQTQIVLESINQRDGLRTVCEFEGRRVAGTDTMAEYTTY